jgi:hypothetical protein
VGFYRDQMAQALMRVPINGGKPEKLTDRIDTGPAASPFDVSADSRYVVMALTEPASSDYKQKLVIQDLITGKEVATPKLRPSYSALPRFTPDARAIVYPARNGTADNLWLEPLDGSPGKWLTDFKDETIYDFHWSTDGGKLAIIRGHVDSDVVLIQDSQ